MTTVATKRQQPIRSTIPARLDRLRWSPFHTRLVLGLGLVEVFLGIDAEGKPLEQVARPLTAVGSGDDTP